MEAAEQSQPAPKTRPAVSRPRRLRWLVLFAALAFLAVRGLVPETLGEQARRSIEAKLATHYPHLEIRIGYGRYDAGSGLVLGDVAVDVPQPDGQSVPLVRIDRLLAETDMHWQRVYDGESPMCASRMIVSGVELNLWADDRQRYSLEQLLPLPEMGPGCPVVLVRDGRLRLMRDPTDPARSIQWQDIRGRIIKMTADDSAAATYRVQGIASSAECQQLSFTAAGGPGGWDVQAAATQLRLDHRRLERLPAPLAVLRRTLDGFSGLGSAQLRLRAVADQPLDWELSGQVVEGRFEHPRIALAAQKISGRYRIGPAGAQFEDVQAYVDGALCRGSAQTDALQWPCTLRCELAADNLLLDGRLAAALPPALRAKWDRLQPSGLVDVSAVAVHERGRWSTAATVQAKGVAVQFDRFPYPVRDLNGTAEFRDGVITCEEMFGMVDGQPLHCQMRLTPAGSGEPLWFRASVDGAIAINDQLLAALTPRGELPTKLETFARSLSAAGGVRVASAEIAIDEAGNKTQRIDLRFEDAQLRYDGFPYPLYGVHGQVLVENETTRLIGFVAENGDAAAVHCDGTYRLTPGGGDLDLRFVGKGVPLDRTLRAALPEASQVTWDALAPVGILQRVDVAVSKRPQHLTPELKLVASLGDVSGVSQNTVSVRPNALPYRMDLVAGTVVYDAGRVTIKQLDARHDATRLAANGTCEAVEDGRWQLDLNVLSGSRMTVDNELISSLPPQVRGVCQRLQLRGPLGVSGKTSLLLPNDRFPQPESRFDLKVQLEGNRIGDVGPVRDIRGELTFRGEQDAAGINADGSVQLDSMHFQGIQLTGVRGPFAVRHDQLLLGVVNPALDKGENFQPIAGRVFGGQFTLSATIGLATSQYEALVSLDKVEVPAVLADFQQTQSDMTGRLSGQIQLEGALGAMHLLKGVGEARLSEANLYQLPQIVQLLNQLRVRPGEEVAFTDGKALFSLSGDQIAFSQLQLWGDLIALHGSGTVSRMRELNLNFNTRVSPQNTWSRLIRPLDSQRYTLWSINVQGPLDAPTIQRSTLEGVSETLDRLFPGMGLDSISQRARSTFGKSM
ncbi:hypothetical protein [Roseimaritima sediminicola]|uniref:hypothetical protein n=1 Tax=Roseimaritima sediminicola TaxID=2662066 RepID=UPI001298582D|nr:hypothetical protein [Roseimaritima sediminicola]